MQVALIPPRGHERQVLRTHFQMMLPHVEHAEYRNAYLAAHIRGDYIMLDNGAAEFANSYTSKQLCVMAKRVGANELVATDHLRNQKRTVRAVAWFLSQFELLAPDYTNDLALMAVAQGRNIDEARECIEAYVGLSHIGILGIPRLLVDASYRAIRIDLANWTESQFPDRFKIHLLGTSPVWPKEVQMAARYAPHVRSVDTSLPFNYAIAGQRLDVPNLPVINRPEDYFVNTQRISTSLLDRNIETVLGWASA